MFPLVDLKIELPSPEQADGERIACKMIDAAYRDGIRGLCYVSSLPFDADASLCSANESVERYASERYPDLTLVASGELHFRDEADARRLSSTPATYGRSDLLAVSLAPQISPESLYQTLMILKESGHGILLTRAETIDCLLSHPTLALRMTELGIRLQLGAGSVLGENGLLSKGFCRKMLKQNAVFSICSHAKDHLRKPPRLSKCYAYLCRHYGDEIADLLLRKNPAMVLGLTDAEEARRIKDLVDQALLSPRY